MGKWGRKGEWGVVGKKIGSHIHVLCGYIFNNVPINLYCSFLHTAPVNGGGGLVSLVVTSIGGATLVIGVVLLLASQRISQPSSAQTTEPQSQ